MFWILFLLSTVLAAPTPEDYDDNVKLESTTITDADNSTFIPQPMDLEMRLFYIEHHLYGLTLVIFIYMIFKCLFYCCGVCVKKCNKNVNQL